MIVGREVSRHLFAGKWTRGGISPALRCGHGLTGKPRLFAAGSNTQGGQSEACPSPPADRVPGVESFFSQRLPRRAPSQGDPARQKQQQKQNQKRRKIPSPLEGEGAPKGRERGAVRDQWQQRFGSARARCFPLSSPDSLRPPGWFLGRRWPRQTAPAIGVDPKPDERSNRKRFRDHADPTDLEAHEPGAPAISLPPPNNPTAKQKGPGSLRGLCVDPGGRDQPSISPVAVCT